MRTNLYSTSLCSSLLLAMLTACGGSTTATTANSVVVTPDVAAVSSISTSKSSLTRNPAPVSSDADVAAAVAGNTEFAIKVLPLLDAQGDANLVYSPYSISQALAMTAAGAKGDTLTGIEKALAFQLQQSRLLPALNRLDLQLADKTAGAGKTSTNLPALNIANALWAQQGYSLQTSYLDAIAVNFGAAVNLLDFSKAPDASRVTINTWVENQTQQKIKNLLSPNDISAGTRVVLTNAIWFKSDWARPFEKESTRNQDFFDRKANKANVPFMFQESNFSYVKGKDYQSIELPYVDNKLAMLVVMPDSGKFDSFVKALTPASLADVVSGLKDQRVALSMPKFNFNASPPLGTSLISLGMDAAFDPMRADFSGMSGNRDLSLTAIVHKAFITVDEKGTEAAAATGVVAGVTAIQPAMVRLTLDHPFLFMIRDRQTGLILFMGKIMNPASS